MSAEHPREIAALTATQVESWAQIAYGCGDTATANRFHLCGAEIARLRHALHMAEFKVKILTNNEAVHLERLRKVDPEWVDAEARIAETEAWWEANGHAELIAHLRKRGFTIAGGEAQ